MFSVAGTTPMTLARGLSRAMAHIAASTAAPPPMSHFIISIPAAGFREMPPVSKVMPLPTSASRGPSGRPPSWRTTIITGGSSLPRATPSSAPIPSRSRSARCSTSTSRPVPA